MRADIPTLLSLLEFTEFIEWNPWPLSQINRNAANELIFGEKDAKCNRATFQTAWQMKEWISRNELASVIEQAEELFYSLTGFHPAPKFITEETVIYPRPSNQFAWQGWATARRDWKAIQVGSKFVQSVGTETLTYVADSAVALSDSDGDGITDTFTVTQAMPAGTVAGEVAVFFITADRLGRPLDIMEIKPIDVSMSGVTATIVGRSYQLVLPALQYAAVPSELAYDNAAIYATSLAVYRRTIDTTDTGSLIWDLPTCPNPPCQYEASTTCFGVRDAAMGWIAPQPAKYDSTLAQFVSTYPNQGYRGPDRVKVNYYAGYPRQSNGRMDRTMAKIISLIAIGNLPDRVCSCATTSERLYWYRMVPGESRGNNTFKVSQQEFDRLPFTEKCRASFMAWNLLKDYVAIDMVVAN